MVGEQGPELFVPKTAGSIVPNNRLGGQQEQPIIINMPVQALDAKSFNGYVLQNKEAIVAAIRQANSNNVGRR
jgi:hypothetical protein